MPNPNWKPLLDVLPESLHMIVTPHLEEWDKNVKAQFEENAAKLAPWKSFIEGGVDPDYLQTAFQFARNFEANPQEVINKANEAFDLGYITKEQAEQLQQPQADTETEDIEFDLDEELDMGSIENNPVIKQLLEQNQRLQQRLDNFDSSVEQDRQAAEFEQFLDQNLTGDKAHVDRDFVTAMMSNGASFDQAVDRYNGAIAKALEGNNPTTETVTATTEQGTAPVVTGQGGNAGAGIAQQDIDFGAMKSGDINDLVVGILQQAAGNE